MKEIRFLKFFAIVLAAVYCQICIAQSTSSQAANTPSSDIQSIQAVGKVVPKNTLKVVNYHKGYVDHIEEAGARVKKNALLVTLRNRDLELLHQIKVLDERALNEELKVAKYEYESTKTSFNANSMSQVRLDRATLAYNLAQAELDKTVLEKEMARENVAAMTIKAPFDGVVAKRHSSVGQLLSEGQNILLFVSDSSELLVKVPLKKIEALLQLGALKIQLQSRFGEVAPSNYTMVPDVDSLLPTILLRVDLPKNDWVLGESVTLSISH